MMYKIHFRKVRNSGIAGVIEFDAEIDGRERAFAYRFTPTDSMISEHIGGKWTDERRIGDDDFVRACLPRGFGWDYGKFMLAATFWEAGFVAREWV